MKNLNNLLGISVLGLFCSSAQALEVPSADVMIQSIAVSPSLTLKVTLYSYWDDAARNVKLQIILPYGLKVSDSSDVLLFRCSRGRHSRNHLLRYRRYER